MTCRFSIFALFFVTFANATGTPEALTRRTSQFLKAISDDDWKSIAGDKGSESYEVIKGDTLYAISKILFGDTKYWPKIWALNHTGIFNAHLIYPGQKIIFTPGTGGSLPAITVGETQPQAVDEPAEKASSAEGKQEWKILPVQSWETSAPLLKTSIDELGFDESSRVRFSTPKGIALSNFVESKKIPYVGVIKYSRSENTYLSLGQTVFITPSEPLDVGQHYTIIQQPSEVFSRGSDRLGYSYGVAGDVKIMGIRDGMFVGLITSAKEFINRDLKIIPYVSRVPYVSPVAGETSLGSTIIIDPKLSTFALAQHKFVYVDRGSSDGVKVGMYFRAFLHRDPMDRKKISDQNFIINADMRVVRVSERFSTLLVTQAFDLFEAETKAILITDVSELLINNRYESALDKNASRTSEEFELLDKLEREREDPTETERKVLRQIENFKKKPKTALVQPDPVESDNATELPNPDMPEAPAPSEDKTDSLPNIEPIESNPTPSEQTSSPSPQDPQSSE